MPNDIHFFSLEMLMKQFRSNLLEFHIPTRKDGPLRVGSLQVSGLRSGGRPDTGSKEREA